MASWPFLYYLMKMVPILIASRYYYYITELKYVDSDLYNIIIKYEPITILHMTGGFNYTNRWMYKALMSQINYIPISSKTCPSCNFTIRNKRSNSTPRDVLLTSVLFYIHNVVPFFRTFRTVGSKASAIFLVDTKAYRKLKAGEMHSFVKNCGGRIINIGDISGDRQALQCFRNIIIHDFLSNRARLIDRILIVDLFDTLFQGDPFTKDLNASEIGLCGETGKLAEHYKAVNILVGEEIGKKIGKQHNINAGTLIGDAKLMYKFLGYYVWYYNRINSTTMRLLRNNTCLIDQIILNIITYCNLTGVPYHINLIDSLYMSCWSLFNRDLPFDIGEFRVNNGSYPLIVHLYDRFSMFVESALRRCPQTFRQYDKYVRSNNFIGGLPASARNLTLPEL